MVKLDQADTHAFFLSAAKTTVAK